MDIQKPDVKFFATVQELCSSRSVPKFDLVNGQVIDEECNALFGGAKKFKVNTPDLKLENMSTLEDIYWWVFGITFVTNNEIPAWMVCGYIAQCKGIPINWTKAIKSTAKEKAHRGEMSKG